MKKQGYIYEKIIEKDNIRMAIDKASKGKRQREDVIRILENKEYYVDELHNILKNQEFKHSEYKVFKIREGISKKERVIHKPQFYPDQIVHWCLMLQIQPIIEKGLYVHSCGSIPGRGIHYGKKYIERWIRRDKKNTKYCLKLDIEKFFPSINNDVLKEMFVHKIKDAKTLNLINGIIDSSIGLPIGNYTSQWFANFYLEKLDHYIKEELKVRYYVRYIDDMVLFGNNKRRLRAVKKLIDEFLVNYCLNIKDNYQVYLVDVEGVDMLGFRFFRDRTILRKSILVRICKSFKRASKNMSISNSHTAISYNGWLIHTDSHNLSTKLRREHIVKNCKRLLSETH